MYFVYCLVSTVFFVYCLVSIIFCWLSCICCLVSTVLCLLSCVYCHVSTILCLLSCVYFLVSNVVFRLSFVYCLVSAVLCQLSCFSCLVSTILCLRSCVYCLVSTALWLLSCVYFPSFGIFYFTSVADISKHVCSCLFLERALTALKGAGMSNIHGPTNRAMVKIVTWRHHTGYSHWFWWNDFVCKNKCNHHQIVFDSLSQRILVGLVIWSSSQIM